MHILINYTIPHGSFAVKVPPLPFVAGRCSIRHDIGLDTLINKSSYAAFMS